MRRESKPLLKKQSKKTIAFYSVFLWIKFEKEIYRSVTWSIQNAHADSAAVTATHITIFIANIVQPPFLYSVIQKERKR